MDTSAGGSMSIARNELFEIWRQESSIKHKNRAVLMFVMDRFSLTENEDKKYRSIKAFIKTFTSKVAKMWKECHRTLEVFKTRHYQWLNQNVAILDHYAYGHATREASRLKKGRPCKDFNEVSNQSKRKKIVPLLEAYSNEELTFAARTSLHMSGRRDAARMVTEVTQCSPKRPTRLKKAFRSPSQILIKYTPEEALALYIDGRYTKNSYILMQSGAKARNANIYPSYNVIKDAKKRCYPLEEDIMITDISAEVNFQALVVHTTSRIMKMQEEVSKQNISELSHAISLIYKWGCDESAAQSNYKQKFSGEGSDSKSDSNLFAVCMVPLQLYTDNGHILWQNPRPSSTRYCRPIKLIFEKETAELAKKEIEKIETQIAHIQATTYQCDLHHNVLIKHVFKMTMIDGKTFGVVTDSSTQTCGICGATPKIMNQLNKVWDLVPNTSHFDYGISNLHAWIRCLECCLHISYRLTIKKWQVRGEEDKKKLNERKKVIVEKLKTEMCLLVDIPKPGYGTTNDGNTARRFFQQYSLASSITGLDEELLKRFYIILKTMSCGYTINTDAFREYAVHSANRFVELYSWYYMPSSIHRILIHGADIIKTAALPIGMFSEEALESRNKDFRRIREFNTRKFTRDKTMRDLLNHLLMSSDPLISQMSKPAFFRSYKEPLSSDIIKLLSEPQVAESTICDISDSDED